MRMLINDVGPAEKIIARGGSMPLLCQLRATIVLFV